MSGFTHSEDRGYGDRLNKANYSLVKPENYIGKPKYILWKKKEVQGVECQLKWIDF